MKSEKRKKARGRDYYLTRRVSLLAKVHARDVARKEPKAAYDASRYAIKKEENK